MAHLCRILILTTILLNSSLSAIAMEVYIPGEIKKTTACCYVVKTSEGRYLKILKPRKSVRNPDPFKFRVTMSFLSDSFSYAYHYWKGKVNFR